MLPPHREYQIGRGGSQEGLLQPGENKRAYETPRDTIEFHENQTIKVRYGDSEPPEDIKTAGTKGLFA